MIANDKLNERCIKGNTAYYKIKIDDMVDYEIAKLGVDKSAYRNFNLKISDELLKFTEDATQGKDFGEIMIKLRDEVIVECANVEKETSSKMRNFFKDYIFDKIYTMGLNIKNGLLPSDYEKELEAAKIRAEEEDKEREEELENEKENNMNIVIENAEEKDPDVVDLMWSYFFGGPKTNSKTQKEKSEVKKETDKKENKREKNETQKENKGVHKLSK